MSKFIGVAIISLRRAIMCNSKLNVIVLKKERSRHYPESKQSYATIYPHSAVADTTQKNNNKNLIVSV